MSEVREEIARALYELWVAEDWNNEYCSWAQLPDKQTWLDRAEAVLAVPEVNTALRFTGIYRQAGHNVGDAKFRSSPESPPASSD